MRPFLLAIALLFFSNTIYGQTTPKGLITFRLEGFLGRVTQEKAEVFRSYQVENKEYIIKDFYLDGTLRGMAKNKNGMTHGLYIGYYKDGSLRDSGHYHKGNRWGSWKVFHKNGKLQLSTNFKDDIFDGMAYLYDTIGNLIAKSECKKGNLKFRISYYPGTTNIKGEMYYVNGKAEGEAKFYYPDGRLKRSMLFKNDKYVEGSGKLYNEEGIEVPYTSISTPISFNGDLTKYILSNMHYPKNSLENNIEGIVYVRAEIDENGVVTDAAVSKGINEECNEEALRIIRSLKFNPPVYDGVAHSTVQRITVPFFVAAFLKRQYLDREKENQQIMQEIENNSNPFK